MSAYDEIEIEDMKWNEEFQAFTYPCPCGDLFRITKVRFSLGYLLRSDSSNAGDGRTLVKG